MTDEIQLGEFLEADMYLVPCHSVRSNGSCTCSSGHDKSHADSTSRGKHPRINEWNKNSSNDPDQIAEWREVHQEINWGVHASRSGLMVFDIDPRNGGEKSFYRFESEFAEVMPKPYRVITGAYDIGNRRVRGEHWYYRVPGDASIIGSLGKDFPGIDIKWNGYVLLPGSKHFSGVTYELAEDSLPASAIAELPPEMLEVLSKPKRRRKTSSSVISLSSRGSAYGNTALKEEVGAIAETREGYRNNTLFRKGIAVSELIGGGELPPSAIAVLAEAAKKSGLSDEEIEKVLFRQGGALEIGLSQPRSAENRHGSGNRELQTQLLVGWEEEFLSKVQPVNWAEAFEADYEEDWFVPGLVARGRSHAIYSEPGTGKSVMTRQMCAELCTGRVVLGTRPYGEPIKVLFFDHENTVIQDVVPQLRELGYTPEQLEMLIYLSFPEMSELDTAEGGKQFGALLDHHTPDLVVLDTVSRTISQDENQNQTWLDFYRHAGVQLKNRGIAYIRLDHTGKNVERGMRGGSAKKGDLDLVWLLTESRTPGRFTLKCEKSRLPLNRKELQLVREIEPLHHTLVIPPTIVDWAEIFKPLERYKALWDLFKSEEAATGKVRGSKKLWEEHQEKLQNMDITKRFVEQTLKDFRDGESALEPW